MFEWLRFFFSGRKEIYGLRKEYDKLREYVDKEENDQKKIGLLRMLDQMEPQIATLEEQKLSGSDARKIKLYVRSSLFRIKGEAHHKSDAKVKTVKRI